MHSNNPRVSDPARGGFDPVSRDVQPSEDNPRGVRRPGKTWQDRLPVHQRPRYQVWLTRQGR